MKYIVKNCPCYIGRIYVWDGNLKNACNVDKCKDCTDCVIKQMIGKCKEYDEEQDGWCEPIPFCTDNIYNLFEIEEIKEILE
ncbi:hypothetical protein IJI31_01025 [bacterium]|nr:hypothetical protein [bacterium]